MNLSSPKSQSVQVLSCNGRSLLGKLIEVDAHTHRALVYANGEVVSVPVGNVQELSPKLVIEQPANLEELVNTNVVARCDLEDERDRLLETIIELKQSLGIAATTLETVYRERDPKNVAAKCAAELARKTLAKAEGRA